MINIGDYVSRKSYNNDIVFEVIGINKEIVKLKGVDVRLIADAPISDLVTCERGKCDDFNPGVIDSLDRNEYFYLPGKILHIDADKSYLDVWSFIKRIKLRLLVRLLKKVKWLKL